MCWSKSGGISSLVPFIIEISRFFCIISVSSHGTLESENWEEKGSLCKRVWVDHFQCACWVVRKKVGVILSVANLGRLETFTLKRYTYAGYQDFPYDEVDLKGFLSIYLKAWHPYLKKKAFPARKTPTHTQSWQPSSTKRKHPQNLTQPKDHDEIKV